MEETLEDWFYEWLEVYVKHTHPKSTYDCYADAIRRIFVCRPEWRGILLSELYEYMLQDFINSLSAKYAKSTLNHMRVVFKQSILRAARNGIHVNSLGTISIPVGASEKEVRALTQKEQRAIEAAASLDPLGDLAIFLLLTGIRPGELRQLRWQDYDKYNRLICIHKSKTKAGERVIPLLPQAQQIIECQSKCGDYIFTSLRNQPLTKTVLRGLCRRLKEATGIEKLTPHMFRHSFATRLVERGIKIKALSTLMGHTSEYFTMQRYVTAEIDFLRNEIELLNPSPVEKVS